MANALDAISLEQLNRLKELGLVVVHSKVSREMRHSATRNRWPESWFIQDIWNRMVGSTL